MRWKLRAGQERAVPLPEEAAKSAKATHDLLRRFKELGTNMKAHAPPSAIEQDLQVGSMQSTVLRTCYSGTDVVSIKVMLRVGA